MLANLNLKSTGVAVLKKVTQVSFDKSLAKEKALKLLELRSRSERELKQKLRQKGFTEKIIFEVVSDLKKVDLINDEKFAESWASSRLANKPMGKFLLKQELFRKGIKKELVEDVIKKSFEDEKEIELAAKLLERRTKLFQNLEDRKVQKKLADFLLRRGFSYHIVNKVMRLKEPEET